MGMEYPTWVIVRGYKPSVLPLSTHSKWRVGAFYQANDYLCVDEDGGTFFLHVLPSLIFLLIILFLLHPLSKHSGSPLVKPSASLIYHA